MKEKILKARIENIHRKENGGHTLTGTPLDRVPTVSGRRETTARFHTRILNRKPK